MANLILMIGTTEIILIAAIALLIFGGKKVPELMRGLGQGIQSFKKGMKEPIDAPDETKETEKKETSEEAK
ncbi:MAG: twin-arginine translocase TatA/TatE family subunit [Prevotellaceae bacterium]|nr:twin-arginine translocase TatA/TatE family subunit [Prevotellaceae bacterium]